MGKKKQKLYKSNQVSDTNYMKIVWITLGVLIVLGLVYFFTALGTGEIKLGKKEKETNIKWMFISILIPTIIGIIICFLINLI